MSNKEIEDVSTICGKLILRKRKFRLRNNQNPILIKTNSRYKLKIGRRSYCLVLNENGKKIVNAALEGKLEITNVELLKKRHKVLICLAFKNKRGEHIKKQKDKKTIIIVDSRGDKEIVATVVGDKKVVHEQRFVKNKRVVDDIIEYANKFEKPVIVAKENIPSLHANAILNGINVGSPNKGLNKKPIIIGAMLLVALMLMAVVYYSSMGTSTITITKKLDISTNIDQNVILFAPGIGTTDIGYVNVTVYGAPTNYQVIIQLANLQTGVGSRVIAIQIYNTTNGSLVGIITPLTPSLVINEYDQGNMSYGVKLFYLTFWPSTVNIALQSSVRLI